LRTNSVRALNVALLCRKEQLHTSTRLSVGERLWARWVVRRVASRSRAERMRGRVQRDRRSDHVVRRWTQRRPVVRISRRTERLRVLSGGPSVEVVDRHRHKCVLRKHNAAVHGWAVVCVSPRKPTRANAISISKHRGPKAGTSILVAVCARTTALRIA
jgi:hypothetical protein